MNYQKNTEVCFPLPGIPSQDIQTMIKFLNFALLNDCDVLFQNSMMVPTGGNIATAGKSNYMPITIVWVKTTVDNFEGIFGTPYDENKLDVIPEKIKSMCESALQT